MSNTELIYSVADVRYFLQIGFWVSSVFIVFTAIIFYMPGNHFGYKSGLLFAKEVLDGQIKVLKEYGNTALKIKPVLNTKKDSLIPFPEQGGNDDKPA